MSVLTALWGDPFARDCLAVLGVFSALMIALWAALALWPQPDEGDHDRGDPDNGLSF